MYFYIFFIPSQAELSVKLFYKHFKPKTQYFTILYYAEYNIISFIYIYRYVS